MNLITVLLWASLAPQAPVPGTVEARVVRNADGELLASLVATQTPVDLVITTLTERMAQADPGNALQVEGFAPSYRAALVTVELDGRPTRTVIETVLGSVGLEGTYRTGTLTVREATTASLDAADLRDRAKDIYDRAVLRFPEHSSAASARLHQGDIEERRGNLTGALLHYEALREIYRGSNLIPSALWRSGKVYQQMGLWNEANETFIRLANLETDHEYRADARLEAARCAVQLDNPDLALRTLEALDRRFPAKTLESELERDIVRADALGAAGRAMEALRTLDRITRNEVTQEHKITILRIQAHAFEAVGEPRHAQRAWMIFAEETVEAERLAALENGARLGLINGDEISVIFLGRLAERDGSESAAELAPYVTEAMRRLGLAAEQPSSETYTPAQRIRAAAELLNLGEANEAHRRLLPMWTDRGKLNAELRVELSLVWGRTLEQRRGLDAALADLRTARSEFAETGERQQLDLLAAELLENNDRFTEAVDAYEGRY